MSDVAQGFARLRARVAVDLQKELRVQSILLVSEIQELYLKGGTTPTRLKVRSGHLYKSLKPVPIKRTAEGLEGGITVGVVYGKIHFGRRGSTTVIRPKTKKYLTIPTEFAQKPSGESLGSALSGMWGDTFFATSKRGNLILFGRRKAQKGQFAGQARGKILPLFVLKKKVEVPARVDPEEILRWWKPRILRAVNRVVSQATREVK